MASAMARGWAGAGAGPEAMVFCDVDAERAAALAREVEGETRGRLSELATDCDVIVLAVKPAALAEVATELEGRAPPLISILAATPIARLNEAFPGVPALRVMPNQPVSVGRGVVCYVPPGDDVPRDLGESLIEALEPLGAVVAVEEALIDAAMAVMSCSPAYVASFAEALAEAGVREGLEPGTAAELVTGAIAGTAELLRAHDPEAIRRAVAPPGGATEAGLEALADAGFDDALGAAVVASLERFR
jgi:pyrroline-5-carboxylate reductase